MTKSTPDSMIGFREFIEDLVLCQLPDPRAPDPTKHGIFRDHNCGGCNSGARPCREGNSRNCSWPRARND